MINRQTFLPIFLLLQVIVIKIFGFFPELVERWYSTGFYVSLSRSMRQMLGWIPFSLGDVLYGILILYSVIWLWRTRKNWRSKSSSVHKSKQGWRGQILKIISFLSVLYFCFHLLWAMNYHRVPLYQKLHISREYSDADLLHFSQMLIERSNQIHRKITGNDSAKIVFPYAQQQVYMMNLAGYRQLAKTFPDFRYEKLCIKPSLISLPLTYMGFAGYLNPFTGEAQVNDLMPMYNFPTTAAHEMAHQIGFASESEANFIGYMASIQNDDLYIQYSGYTYALKYCLHNWKIRNQKVYEQLMPTVLPGIIENYEESERFWDQYESFIETGFKIFYDNFLKFNQQKDGLDSYSKFVDLLVNYYKVEKF